MSYNEHHHHLDVWGLGIDNFDGRGFVSGMILARKAKNDP